MVHSWTKYLNKIVTILCCLVVPGLVVMVRDLCQRLVGSNPSTGNWMDIFHICCKKCIVCLKGPKATHLSNQCYEICVRRETGMCFICYTPTISAAVIGQVK